MEGSAKFARDVLKKLVDAFETGGGIVFGSEIADLLYQARDAISIPLRNCDVGTADEQDERFKNFCLSYYEPFNVDGECWKCPLFKTKTRCQIAWAQMPYEQEQKGEKDGTH